MKQQNCAFHTVADQFILQVDYCLTKIPDICINHQKNYYSHKITNNMNKFENMLYELKVSLDFFSSLQIKEIFVFLDSR